MENISAFDLVALVVLVGTIFWGGMRGVVSQVAAIATWIVSWQLASRYYWLVDRFVTISEPWRRPVASLIVFVASAIAIGIAARFLKRGLSLAGMREFDRQMGALVGGLKGALICVVLAFFATVVSDKTRAALVESKSGPFFVSVASVVVSKTCAETEIGQNFLQTAQKTFGSGDANGENAPKSLESEVDELKSYLKRNVFSSTAADVVEGADAAEAGETSGNAASKRSIWDMFRGSVEREKSDENGSGTAPSSPSNGTPSGEGERENDRNGWVVWNDWNGWGGDDGSGNWNDSGAANERSSTSSAISSGLEDLAAFLKRTLGGESEASSGANAQTAANDGVANFAGTSSGVASASNGSGAGASDELSFLDEFIGVAPTREKYGGANADENGSQADSNGVAPVLPFDARESGRLRIVPPATW